MNILLVITSLGRGGAERQVVDLADEFHKTGHNVAICTLMQDVVLVPGSNEVRVIPLGISGNPLHIIRAFARFRKLIRAFKPDVVHSHLVHATLFSRLARILLPMPRLICTAHNTSEERWYRYPMYRLTNWLGDAFTNVSVEAVQAFESAGAVHRDRMLAIHNGVDTDAFAPAAGDREQVRASLGIDANSRVVLSVGRLVPQKDYPNLLHALAMVKGEGGRFQALVAGDGPLRRELGLLATKLGLGDSVKFLGPRSDIPRLMRAADVFALPSASEGFGLVVAEAMATGRVVVATDCGGVAEVVGDCGFMVPPGSPKGLAIALTSALALKSNARQELEGRAMARARTHFSIRSAASKWLSLYQSTDSEPTACAD